MNLTVLQRFLGDSGGNLTTMFALTLLPVLGLIGITVDYTQSSTRKATLDSIADSASLAAVTPARNMSFAVGVPSSVTLPAHTCRSG